MSYHIDEKLVIAISSSALFQLEEENKIFQKEGLNAYRKYQREHEFDILKPGIAFPFIRRFLQINNIFPDKKPVEVVLLSHNDSDTGNRILRCIDHYKLDIERSAFLTNDSPFNYIHAYNVELFLSTNENDVFEAMQHGCAAGHVLKSNSFDDEDDNELRIAFDFDGVLADDSSEKVFQNLGVKAFVETEKKLSNVPMPTGPLASLFSKLATFHQMEDEKIEKEPDYHRFLKTSIVTARSGTAHFRIATTLRHWNITVDQTFNLGGMDKSRVLQKLRPHIFFDDQCCTHLETARQYIPSVHIPFGCGNTLSHKSNTRK